MQPGKPPQGLAPLRHGLQRPEQALPQRVLPRRALVSLRVRLPVLVTPQALPGPQPRVLVLVLTQQAMPQELVLRQPVLQQPVPRRPTGSGR